MNTFSFIIISYNRPADTIEAVRNVLELEDVKGWRKEIIVLNNGSDVSYKALEDYLALLSTEQKQGIRYIDNKENVGVAGGRNFCIREATGAYLLFMDDDSEIETKDVMAKVLALYRTHEKDRLAIIGFLGKNTFTGKTETPLKDPELINGKRETFYNLFFGYGHVFPKSLVEETGYYQDDFFYGMEEYDLSYAAVKAGYSILFTQDILVLHKQNPEGREPGVSTYARMFANKIIVVYKHLPMLYVVTHFILWSCFFLYKSGFKIGRYFKTLRSLKQRLKKAPRNVMPAERMKYLHDVGARLWY
jgi:GT2 family glycosyltransferase